jgi:hypothetical protein
LNVVVLYFVRGHATRGKLTPQRKEGEREEVVVPKIDSAPGGGVDRGRTAGTNLTYHAAQRSYCTVAELWHGAHCGLCSAERS